MLTSHPMLSDQYQALSAALGVTRNTYTCIHVHKPLRLLWILVYFVVCDSSFFLLCSLLSFIVVHYARDCSCVGAGSSFNSSFLLPFFSPSSLSSLHLSFPISIPRGGRTRPLELWIKLYSRVRSIENFIEEQGLFWPQFLGAPWMDIV